MTARSAPAGQLLARNAVLQFVGQAFPLMLGLVSIPFVVRVLGPERFGLLSLAWGLIAYFAVFDLGLGRAATKLLAEMLAQGRDADVAPVVWSAVLVQLGLGVVGAVVLGGLTRVLVDHVLKIPPDLVGEARGSLYILSCSVPIFLVMGTARGILEAAQRFDMLNLVRGPYLASYFLTPLLGAVLGLDLTGIIGLLVLAAVMALVAYAWLSVRELPPLRARPRVRSTDLRRLLAFGSWVSVTALLGPILVQLDRFMVGAMLSIAAVAYYAAPYEMVTRLWIVPSSLTATLFPAFSALRAERNDERLPRILRRSLRHLLITVGPIVAVLIPFARDAAWLMFGPEYALRSTPVLQILALGVLINSLAFVPVALIQAVGRPDVSAKFHLLEVPLHLVLVWWLVREFGIVGAAIAWSARVTLDLVLQFGAAARLTTLSTAWFSADRIPQALLLLALVGLGSSALVVWVVPIGLRLVLLTGLLLAVALVVWRYLLDAEERGSLLRIVRRAI